MDHSRLAYDYIYIFQIICVIYIIFYVLLKLKKIQAKQQIPAQNQNKPKPTERPTAALLVRNEILSLKAEKEKQATPSKPELDSPNPNVDSQSYLSKTDEFKKKAENEVFVDEELLLEQQKYINAQQEEIENQKKKINEQQNDIHRLTKETQALQAQLKAQIESQKDQSIEELKSRLQNYIFAKIDDLPQGLNIPTAFTQVLEEIYQYCTQVKALQPEQLNACALLLSYVKAQNQSNETEIKQHILSYDLNTLIDYLIRMDQHQSILNTTENTYQTLYEKYSNFIREAWQFIDQALFEKINHTAELINLKLISPEIGSIFDFKFQKIYRRDVKAVTQNNKQITKMIHPAIIKKDNHEVLEKASVIIVE